MTCSRALGCSKLCYNSAASRHGNLITGLLMLIRSLVTVVKTRDAGLCCGLLGFAMEGRKVMHFRERIKQSFFVYSSYMFMKSRIELVGWSWKGRPNPPPHLIKQRCVLDYQRRFGLDVLVETGTYQGAMIHATHSRFKEIYSIELSSELHQRAKIMFAHLPHVHLIQGDSAVELGNLVQYLDRPCLFWLDAHYSGGITARGIEDTPIMAEMNYITKHSIKKHVVLIDDARCFNGSSYPHLDQLKQYVTNQRPDLSLSIHEDIIRIVPR